MGRTPAWAFSEGQFHVRANRPRSLLDETSIGSPNLDAPSSRGTRRGTLIDARLRAGAAW